MPRIRSNRTLLLAATIVGIAPVNAQTVATLGGPGRAFARTNHLVSATVFHWFGPADGQVSGPWRPIEGRSNWTGETAFWQGQIKQIMAANIDTMYVHLFDAGIHEQRRVNLFKALNQLRTAGYDVPKVAPFLDPSLTWFSNTIDVATPAGKDNFANQYIRFYNQYYSVNQDAHADSYIDTLDGRPVLDTWHAQFNLTNINSLSRSDVTTRLSTALGSQHALFNNDVYMVTTALNPPTLAFADEKLPQFETNAYYADATFSSIRAAQVKAGYWDQNIRNPGSFVARSGGTPFKTAWDTAVTKRSTANLRRVNVESWNEYDEGSGIYAANTGAPYIAPGSGNTNTDTWSSTNDPFEYIKTTAEGARRFNDTADRDAKILWEDFPTSLSPGETRSITVIVRNQGDYSWSAANNYKFGQQEFQAGEVLFGPSRYLIDDSMNEIPTYGGIFRGRPITFQIDVTAPSAAGSYITHWGMLQESVAWFGEVAARTIVVSDNPTQQVINVGYDLTLPRLQFAGGGIAVNVGFTGSGQTSPAKLSVGSITVDSADNNYLANSLSSNTVYVTGGMTIAALSTLHRTGGGLLRTASFANSGTLDLGDTKMILDYSGSSPLTTIRTMLVSGCANGAWNGTGINSAAAAGGALQTAIGYCEAFAVPVNNFAGETVDTSTILLRYTYCGDADLNGTVNSVDFNRLMQGYGRTTGIEWIKGDFNFDGKVNTLDFNALAGNYGLTMSSPILGSIVPEPATFSLLLLVALTRNRAVYRPCGCSARS
jgi:hypothetical protein